MITACHHRSSTATDGSLVPRQFLHVEGKNSLVNGHFGSCYKHKDLGAPIRLIYWSDVYILSCISTGMKAFEEMYITSSIIETKME